MKYRRKTTVVEAVQWLGTQESFSEIMNMGDVPFGPGEMDSYTFIITTRGWDHLVRRGDFVIKGVAGEFYSCKPDIFAATYEEVEE